MRVLSLLLAAQATQTDIENKHKLETRWGFLKNIVNIDRFFSAGHKETGAAEPERPATSGELLDANAQ